ncbi:MAG: hypothetical protein Q8J68_08270 [Methanolobus sp.]|uniref:hypothetical protein n=1 Tax=Methanolobus sp. TaxID=1874737 RepID=UPI00272F96EB|nr:hypothetical protein [Methanolobus sp.]MDP2217265.1 hypothetical protein [Methanolobus sp.]
MKNQWIQHLERASPEKRERGTSFVKMLHVLSRDGGKGKDSHFHMKCRSQLSRSKVSEKKEQHIPACAEDHAEHPIITSTATLSASLSSVDQPLNEDNVCAELCRWTAKSQLGYETGIDSPGNDFVQLLKPGNGQIMLRYNVTGEEVFEIGVGSVEEAEKVISEDNMTTSMLYPGNPEFQWSKK